MSNLLPYIIFLFGSFIFLFTYWKKLKEDYAGVEIFTSGFYILAGIGVFTLIFGLLLKSFLHDSAFFTGSGLWFWGGVAGATVGFIASILRFRLKLFETFEAMGIGLLFFILLFFIYDALKNQSIFSLIGSVILTGLVGVFFFLEGNYRKFTWYKSGKVGFSGLSVIGLLFLLRTVVGLTFPFVFSFIGRVDALISGSISFILFLLLYNLGEQ